MSTDGKMNLSKDSKKTGSCQYHLCDKENVELFQCPYCKDYFCKEHLEAKLPKQPDFRGISKENRLAMKEYRKPGGHPCPSYFDFCKAIEKPVPHPKDISFGPELRTPSKSKHSKKIKEPAGKIKVSEVKCDDCGKNLLHQYKHFIFDKDAGKHITLCPECWNKRQKRSKKRETTENPSTKITNDKSVYKIAGVILIILLLITLFSLYNITLETFDSYSKLSVINNKIQDARDEVNSLNSQINSTEKQLLDVNSEVKLLQSGNKYELHDPTYSEVLNFLSKDKTDLNDYGSGYTCVFFSTDVNNNAESQGIRCAYVELDFVDSGHAIVAFETTDRGLVYFEPQHDVRADIDIGKRFYQCLSNLPGSYWVTPNYDDTIESITRFW